MDHVPVSLKVYVAISGNRYEPDQSIDQQRSFTRIRMALIISYLLCSCDTRLKHILPNMKIAPMFSVQEMTPVTHTISNAGCPW